MEKLLMALDAGTTSNRCILFNKKGTIVKMQQREFTQYFPKPGWVEHDAEEIWLSMYSVASEALANAGATAEDIAAIGITNQRETVIMWDRKTGDPVCRAIVWQDRRTADYCQELKNQGLEEFFRSRTGLLIDPYFSGTKVRWILENVEGVRERAERGEIAFGTVETWLIWKLTGGKVHITDYSNASRTLLYNIYKLEWDQEILDLFGIPASILPEVRPSSEIYGETAYSRFNGCIPIAGAAGDQQAALFGQTCFKPGECKNTYGTGCFLLMNTGREPVEGKNGLLTTIAWGINGHVTYALEGSVFIGGAVIKWLVEELKILDSSSDSEYFARKVPDTNGCYIVPAFTGLGAPYWDPYARGAIVGLTRGVNRYHIIRAAEESIAYQSNDLLELMTKNSGIPVTALKVDGGATRDNLLLQFQSDISDVPVTRPENVETTALGAAYLAGLAVGYYESPDEVLRNWRFGEVFKPSMPEEEREKKLRGWHKAVEKAKDWARDED